MLIEAVAFFLSVSVLFYCLFAGADFGAGILEAFMGRKYRDEQREVISHAISPVWEANHVWLILGIVILFVGFPKAYSVLSITFHIPLVIMLLGVVLRGCAFTFRHYDVIKDKSHQYYSAIFIASSFVTPFILGVIAGGLLLGRTFVSGTGWQVGSAPNTLDFYQAYVSPWFNVFSAAIGGFTCVLFSFLAAVFLIGETKDPEVRRIFKRRALTLNVIAVVSGIGVFLAAQAEGLELLQMFASRDMSLAAMLGATIILTPLWYAIKRNAYQLARLLAAAQVALILVGWFDLQFPIIINSHPRPITIYNTAAPEATLWYLLYALIAGSIVIFPSLIYLLKIFKTGKPQQNEITSIHRSKP